MSEKICKNCKFSLKRCPFSFKKYGNYSHGYECTKDHNDVPTYKRLDDTCNQFQKKTS